MSVLFPCYVPGAQKSVPGIRDAQLTSAENLNEYSSK